MAEQAVRSRAQAGVRRGGRPVVPARRPVVHPALVDGQRRERARARRRWPDGRASADERCRAGAHRTGGGDETAPSLPSSYLTPGRPPGRGGAPRAGGRQGGTASPLVGKRVLVVEDEALLAMKLRDALERHGCVVVGPVARLARAQALLDGEAVDGAVLDINLAGTLVFPLALELRRRGIPFVFATGYDGSVIYPTEVQDAPRVRKPYGDEQILSALERAFRARP